MILNGVCVIWKGWIDLQRLDGMGCLEFDEERAQQEDALAQQAFEEARRRTREFEDRDRSHREEMEFQVIGIMASPLWLQWISFLVSLNAIPSPPEFTIMQSSVSLLSLKGKSGR
nr:core-binding factor subunit beta isoform X1 [Pelodiscus sinensis]|eukprot:XP_006113875.1 core-binding factor subunit beta isoform X1 [Pelodiscus sinensis]